ncbi:MAG: metal-sensing transcriptional repressor, partial [Psychrobacter glacincola]
MPEPLSFDTAVTTRLKKANGHISSTIEVLVAGRTCLDVAQQLQAVENAIHQAKKVLIQDHLDHCLEDLLGAVDKDQQNSIEEFKEIIRYL